MRRRSFSSIAGWARQFVISQCCHSQHVERRLSSSESARNRRMANCFCKISEPSSTLRGSNRLSGHPRKFFRTRTACALDKNRSSPLFKELNARVVSVIGVTDFGLLKPPSVSPSGPFRIGTPAGDKMLSNIGRIGERADRIWDFAKVPAHDWFWFPPYESMDKPSNHSASNRSCGDPRDPQHSRQGTARVSGGIRCHRRQCKDMWRPPRAARG